MYGAGLDLISGKFFGLYSLTLGLLGSLIGLGENKLYKDVWLVPAVGIFSATAVKGLIALMLATMAGMRVPDFSGFLWILLGEAVLNTLFGVPIYFWFRAYLHNKQNTGTSWKIR